MRKTDAHEAETEIYQPEEPSKTKHQRHDRQDQDRAESYAVPCCKVPASLRREFGARL
jgi:hypothetical protein